MICRLFRWAGENSNLRPTDYEIALNSAARLARGKPVRLSYAQLRADVGSSVPVSVPTSGVNAAVKLAASSCAGT